MVEPFKNKSFLEVFFQRSGFSRAFFLHVFWTGKKIPRNQNCVLVRFLCALLFVGPDNFWMWEWKQHEKCLEVGRMYSPTNKQKTKRPDHVVRTVGCSQIMAKDRSSNSLAWVRQTCTFHNELDSRHLHFTHQFDPASNYINRDKLSQFHVWMTGVLDANSWLVVDVGGLRLSCIYIYGILWGISLANLKFRCKPLNHQNQPTGPFLTPGPSLTPAVSPDLLELRYCVSLVPTSCLCIFDEKKRCHDSRGKVKPPLDGPNPKTRKEFWLRMLETHGRSSITYDNSTCCDKKCQKEWEKSGC